MSDQEQDSVYLQPIQPDVVAAKLAAINNFEYPKLRDEITACPRLVELLWYIQWLSLQPGGLKRFVQQLLSECQGYFGTPTMHANPLKAGQRYSAEVCQTVFAEIPWELSGEFSQETLEPEYIGDIDPDPNAIRSHHRKLTELNYDFFLELCQRAAIETLPRFLASLCIEIDKTFNADSAVDLAMYRREVTDLMVERHHNPKARPRRSIMPRPKLWYMRDFTQAVFKMMDRQIALVKERLAETVVSIKVWESLEYACAERCLIRIDGDPRFGKTESVDAFCKAYPGQARLVTVPCSNADTDLYKAMATALGIRFDHRTHRRELKAKVEYVLSNSHFAADDGKIIQGIFCIFDEGSFLFPQMYSATTPPMRLNWLRQEIVDKNLPMAVISTPQTYKLAEEKFLKKTGHRFEQFLGRCLLTVNLPSELDARDLIAVAKIHFPEFGNDDLEIIAGRAMRSEGYLKAVEAIAKRARYLAKKNGHKSVTSDDLETALEEVTPSASETQPPSSVQPSRKRRAAPLKRPLKVDSARQIAPVPGPRFTSEHTALTAA